MGKLTTFLCMSCVFCFVNVAFSRVLDYKKERSNICENVGIKPGEKYTSREEDLINEVYKARQEAENERERTENERERVNEEKADAHNQRERARVAEEQKKNADKVIGAVAGRGAVESLYIAHVKRYLPTTQPGVPYTKLEIDKAYTDFFNDQENELAQALLKELPNWKNTDLAITIRKIYGKLSYADHSLFHTLKKMHNLNQVIEYIKAIGASLSDSDLVVVEKIATVLLERDEFYTQSTTVNTAPTSKPGTK